MSFRGGKGGRGGGNRRDFSPSGPRFRDRSGRGKGGPQFMGPRGPMGPNRMMPPRMSGPRGGLLDDLPPRHDDFPMRPRMGARVLVGNLPMRVLRKDLEDKFLKYGPIVDMEVFGDYAILEFEAFISAEDAIRHEHGVPFMGQKAVVEWAKPPNPDGPMPGGGPRGLLDDQFPPEVPSLLNNIRPDVPFGRDFGPDFGPRGPMPVPEPLMPMDAPHPPFEDEFQRSRHPFREDVGSRSNAPLRDDFPASNGGARGSVGASSAPSDNPAKKGKASTDLEIIVLNKQQQRYAEMVERKLRTLGISVDLLFPREGAPIPAILNSISKRGALYAAVISPQNEKEGSITINILFGNPVERRNIPLDEAVKTIGENFDDFVRRGGKDGERVRMVIPEPIRALFSAIMEGRSVTDADYGTAIGFLQDRREAQFLGRSESLKRAATSPGDGGMSASKVSAKKQDVDQLGDGGATWRGMRAAGIDFSSPSVQRAMDSLLVRQPVQPLIVPLLGAAAPPVPPPPPPPQQGGLHKPTSLLGHAPTASGPPPSIFPPRRC